MIVRVRRRVLVRELAAEFTAAARAASSPVPDLARDDGRTSESAASSEKILVFPTELYHWS